MERTARDTNTMNGGVRKATAAGTHESVSSGSEASARQDVTSERSRARMQEYRADGYHNRTLGGRIRRPDNGHHGCWPPLQAALLARLMRWTRRTGRPR